MADAGCEIILLAGDLAGWEQCRDLGALAERLAALGHVPRVLCIRSAGGHAFPDLTECPGLGRWWRLPWASRGLRFLAEDPGRPRLLHILESSLGVAGLEIAERWGLPYLLAVEEYPGRNAKFRLSRDRCRGLVAANDELAGVLARDYGLPPAWIHAIPRGICPPAAPPSCRVPDRVPVVGAAGALVQGSGFATFLSAAKRVLDAGVDVEFVIAGQGEDEIELRRRADRLRIADRITFADDRSAHLGFWDVLDVFCQTSVSPTIGRSLAVAMSHGVPSIASDVGGMRTLIDHEQSGLRIPPGDPGALARAILSLLADPDRARALGDRGRDAALEAHDPDLEASRLDRLYRAVVAAPGPRPPVEAEVQAPVPAGVPAVAINPGRPAARIGKGSLAVTPSRGPVPRPSRPIS